DDEFNIVSDNSDNIKYKKNYENEFELLKRESENFINNWNRKENNKIFNNKKLKIDENIDESINDMGYKYNETNFEDFELLLKEENLSTQYLKNFLTKNINNIKGLRINIKEEKITTPLYKNQELFVIENFRKETK
ncbi:6593_t:CDS:2, partial [Dentiscutata erythropus]